MIVAVDLTAILKDRVGKIEEHLIEQFMEPRIPNGFGDFGRRCDIKQ